MAHRHGLRVEVETELVRNETDPALGRLDGSPTILIDGLDIDPKARLGAPAGFT